MYAFPSVNTLEALNLATTTPPSKKTGSPTRNLTSIIPPKTMRVNNLSGQGIEIIFQVNGNWEHYWIDGSSTIEVPDVPLSQTVSELIRRQVLSVHRS